MPLISINIFVLVRLPEVNYNSEAKTIVVHPNNKISFPLRCLLASTTFAVFNE